MSAGFPCGGRPSRAAGGGSGAAERAGWLAVRAQWTWPGPAGWRGDAARVFTVEPDGAAAAAERRQSGGRRAARPGRGRP